MVDGEIVDEELLKEVHVMVARVTLAEIDAVRMSIDAALELYRTSVVPALHEQTGYEGCYVLTTPEGKAMVLTFWDDEEAAEAGLASGHYARRSSKFVTFFQRAARPRALRRRRRRPPAAREREVRPMSSSSASRSARCSSYS